MSRRRIIPYQQLEFSDCGITCIRIIARYFGMAIEEIFIYEEEEK